MIRLRRRFGNTSIDRPVDTRLLDLTNGWHHLHVKRAEVTRASGSGAPLFKFHLARQPDSPVAVTQFMPHLVGRNDVLFFQTMNAYGVSSDLIQSMGMTYRGMAAAIDEAKPTVRVLLAYRAIGSRGYPQVRAVQRGL